MKSLETKETETLGRPQCTVHVPEQIVAVHRVQRAPNDIELRRGYEYQSRLGSRNQDHLRTLYVANDACTGPDVRIVSLIPVDAVFVSLDLSS